MPGPGLFGGYPTSTNGYLHVRGAKPIEQMRGERTHPGHGRGSSRGEGELGRAQRRSTRSRRPTTSGSTAGRAPAATAIRSTATRRRCGDDVIAGRVSREWAERAYGVMLAGGDTAVDAAATEAPARGDPP